jgi:O-antigen/teichoic acid export membrane protein
VAVFSHDVLRLWINQEYANQGAGIMKILCAGIAVGCLFASHSFYLLGTGRNRWLALLAFAQGVITSIACAVLVPRIGLEGAGWGLTLGTLSQLVFLIYLWKQHFRAWISAPVYFAATFGQCAVGGVLALLFIQLRATLHWSPGWMALAAAGWTVALICGAAIVAVDSLMPGGTGRRNLAIRFGLSLRPLPDWRTI